MLPNKENKLQGTNVSNLMSEVFHFIFVTVQTSPARGR